MNKKLSVLAALLMCVCSMSCILEEIINLTEPDAYYGQSAFAITAPDILIGTAILEFENTFILLGEGKVFGSILLRRYDTQFNLIWSSEVGLPTENAHVVGVVQSPVGSLFVLINPSRNGYIVRKLSPSGDLLGSQEALVSNARAKGLAVLSNGHLCIIGDLNTSSLQSDVFVTIFDENMSIDTDTVFTASVSRSVSNLTVSDNQMIITGVSGEFIEDNIFVKAINPAGEGLWETTLDFEKQMVGTPTITHLSDGKIIVAFHENRENKTMTVATLDQDGTVISRLSYGGKHGEFPSDIEPFEDGGILITGSSSSYSVGGLDIFVTRIDASGQQKWVNIYGGKDADTAKDLIVSQSGDILIAGATASGNAFGDFTGAVLRLDADGHPK